MNNGMKIGTYTAEDEEFSVMNFSFSADSSYLAVIYTQWYSQYIQAITINEDTSSGEFEFPTESEVHGMYCVRYIEILP